ncbi:MAG: hypothetical protein NC820_05735, partial [Candidatus Omnitrophica bacterium]|nr:hypothetical protein [Candidatus Omnitrophota bacterium]
MRRVGIFLIGIFLVMGIVSPIYAGRLPWGLDKTGDIIPQSPDNINSVIPSRECECGMRPDVPFWEIMRRRSRFQTVFSQQWWRPFFIELDKLKKTVEERAKAISEKYAEQIASLKDHISQLRNEMESEIKNEVKLYDERIAIIRNYIEKTLKEWKEERLASFYNDFIDKLNKAIEEGRYEDIPKIVDEYITAVNIINEGYNSKKIESENKIKELEEEKELAIKAIRKKFAVEIKKLEKSLVNLKSEMGAAY